jgi:hypothetical protein
MLMANTVKAAMLRRGVAVAEPVGR